MKSVGARNKVMWFLEMEGGFDTYIIEDPSDFMVMIDLSRIRSNNYMIIDYIP